MSLLEEIVLAKKEEIRFLDVDGKRSRSIYSFKKNLSRDNINIIAEIKERSPSAGFIRSVKLEDVVSQYRRFAKAISVLTDKRFFGGSFDRLQRVASMVNMPVLCKDFIIDRVQIDKAFLSGADMVLLIVRILDKDRLKNLYEYAVSLGLEVLVEVHEWDELEVALELGCDIIGVNSRDLDTLEISLERAKTLLQAIGNRAVRVAESGIKTREDIRFLRDSCEAFLIGEALLKGERLWK